MVQQVYRYEVPVDDHWHTLALQGPVLHVDCRHPGVVEVWAMHYGFDHETTSAEYAVFGTGHPLPEDAGDYVGTAIAPGGYLVWHLMRRTS